MRCSLAFAVLLALPSSLSATTIYVPGDQATIQLGIDAAAYGDTVEVACGAYEVDGVQTKSGVTLRSTTGLADCVTLDTSVDPLPLSNEMMYCSGDSTTRIEGFTFDHGLSSYLGGQLNCTGSPVISNCVFRDYMSSYEGSQPAVYSVGSPQFVDCEFFNNTGKAVGASGGTLSFTRCLFQDNCACDQGCGGAVYSYGTYAQFNDCQFFDNWAYFEGGAISGSSMIVERCVFKGNGARGPLASSYGFGGGAIFATGQLTVIDCTFYGNYMESENALGADILLENGTGELIRCIFDASTFNPSISCANGATITATCTNIYGDPSVTWVGCVAGELGVNGNISADPVFCAATGGDFRLSSISPCLGAPCGTMGALGLGCFDAKPRIISIKDVGNDQGRQARITWYRAGDDFPNSPFNGYAIYRRQDLYAKALPPMGASRETAALLGWDYVATVPHHFDDVYQFVAPTLCDSTITAGQCWSVFFISAMTPTAFYDSAADSGYSKDNIAPPTPTNFGVAYNTGSGNRLVWDAVAANDFASFRVYRGNSPGFVPSPVNRVATTTQTTWTDPAYDGWDVFYKVASTDLAGNESPPAGAGTTTAVGGQQPLALFLGTNAPNPFNPTTTIPFVLPAAGRTRVAIYDVKGSLVRVLVDQELPVGPGEAIWDGKDDAGVAISSGVYLCRLEHPAGVRTTKLVAVK